MKILPLAPNIEMAALPTPAQLESTVERLKLAMPHMSAEQSVAAIRLLQIMRSTPPAPVSILTSEQAGTQKLDMERSLALFFREAWKVLEPGKPLLWSWHYELISEYLTLVIQKKLRRLIINVPPRTSKSNQVTKAFPVWGWLQNPSLAFLFGSYSTSLSTDHSVHRRNLIQSNWFQQLWGDRFQLSPDRNMTTQFSNDKTGTMIATSTGSGAEGRGGDIIILDDPMSNNQAMSDVERRSANKWVTSTLKQRLNDPASSSIVIVMQRLHELDTTGYVQIADEGQWEVLDIPLVAEHLREYSFPVTTDRKVVRQAGDVLQPERFTPNVVKEKQGDRLVYAGQYQQRPAPLEGNIIKHRDIKYFGGIDPETNERDEELPKTFDMAIISVDAAFKDKKFNTTEVADPSIKHKGESDYVAIGVIAYKGRKRYILSVVNEHLDMKGTVQAIKQQRETWERRVYIAAVLVEDKANGPAVIQKLKEDEPGVLEINPQGGKIARFVAVAPEWQAGDWYVDRNAAWAKAFVHQITTFPMAAFDDMADMMSQAGIYLGGEANLDIWRKLAS